MSPSYLGPAGYVLNPFFTFARAGIIDDLVQDLGPLRLRGRHEAGEEIKPGRLVVLENGRAVHGAPSRGPVIGVALARRFQSSYAFGSPVLALRGGIVVVDGEFDSDASVVRVDSTGRFVKAGGEVLSRAVAFHETAVELNL